MDVPETPTASVVIPAWQAAAFIGETLSSVASQTRADFEVLVIDDGSTDDLRSACSPFLTDTRFQLHHFTNSGPTVARNRGIERARGRYVSFLDSDDLMEPTYLEEMVGALDRTPDAAVACCDARMFGVPEREGRLLSEFEPMDAAPTLMNVLERRFLVYTGATMRTEAVRAVGGMKSEMPAAEDFDLWVRMLMAGNRFVFVNKPLARYRRRAGSLSNTPWKMHLGQAQAYLRALGTLDHASPEAAVCRRKLTQAVGLMEFHEGERALLNGDTGRAGVHLGRARRQGVLSRRWRALELTLAVFPSLAVRMTRRRQERLDPLARLAVAPVEAARPA